MSILKSNKNRKIHVRCLYMHSLTQTRVEVWDNINNLSDGLSNTFIYLFADDTKLARVIHSVDEVRLFQQDINKVSDWVFQVPNVFQSWYVRDPTCYSKEIPRVECSYHNWFPPYCSSQ